MFMHLQIILAFRFVIIMCVTYKLYKTLYYYVFNDSIYNGFTSFSLIKLFNIVVRDWQYQKYKSHSLQTIIIIKIILRSFS